MAHLPPIRQVLYRQDWQGYTVEVVDEEHHRSLYFSNHMVQSRMLLAHPLWLHLPYTRHMLASLLFNKNPRDILMIGLGGGSLAKFFLHHFPHCRMEVVEDNPAMVEIARRFFYLPTASRLTIHDARGETFVANRQESATRYDLILVDAYDQGGMSRGVYARDFLLKIHALLSDSGVMVINTNRSEKTCHATLLRVMTHCLPPRAFRLPVQHSNSEILFYVKQDTLWQESAEHHQQALAWVDHPDLDFIDFMDRMTPLQPAFWRRWIRYLVGHPLWKRYGKS